MTTKADYTAEEWQALVRMPAGASLAVMLAEDSGRRGRRKEMAALDAAAGTLAADYADNTLVQALLPDVQAHIQSDEVTQYEREKPTTQAIEVALEWAKQAKAILDAKSNFDEATGYYYYVLRTALDVANAAADAEFLGIGGETLSLGERKTLLKLVDAFAVDFDY